MEFEAFDKIARLSRGCTITEKIDGTNACIAIGEAGEFFIGSRSRWITPGMSSKSRGTCADGIAEGNSCP